MTGASTHSPAGIALPLPFFRAYSGSPFCVTKLKSRELPHSSATRLDSRLSPGCVIRILLLISSNPGYLSILILPVFRHKSHPRVVFFLTYVFILAVLVFLAALRVSLVSVSRNSSLVVCRLLPAVASHGAQAQ